MSNPFPELQSFDPANGPRPVQPRTIEQADSWFAQEMRRERDSQIRQTIEAAPNPDQVARGTRVAREAGVPPLMVDGRLDDAERGLNAQKLTGMMERYPAIGKWAASDPRGVVAAQDDHKALGILGGAWDFLKNAPGRIGVAGGARLGQYATGLNNQIEEFQQTLLTPIYAAMSEASRTFGLPMLDPTDVLKNDAERRARNYDYFTTRADAASKRFQGGSPITEGLLAGTESSVMTVAAMLTRDPKLAASAMGALVGGNAYQEARNSGRNIADATRYSLAQGIPEGVFEMAPASSLLTDVANKLPIGKVVGHYLAEELPNEMATQVFQSYSEWQTMHPEKSQSDWIAGLPAEMQQVALGVIGGGTVTAVTTKAVQHSSDLLAGVAQRYDASRQAQTEATVLDRSAKAMQESKLASRDPEAARAVVRALAEDAGSTHVYIPGEAAQAFLQSDSYDPDSSPFSGYESDIHEAAVSGGDFVMPIEDALTKLPGTPAWEALRPNMRLTPGGMSLNEADEFNAHVSDIMAEMSNRIATQEAATAKQRSAIDRLTETIATKLGESYTSPDARAMANIAAAYYATRAARNGVELTGNEFDNVDVRQVLPEMLAELRKADGTDLVINAMRKGGDAYSGAGPSLLEWIAKRGGIEDRGGDVASMGGDKWHKGKVGRRKLLKPVNAAQGNMLGSSGANPNNLENLLDAAISEGYFPDLLAARESGEKIDNRVLLEAIGKELAGSPIHAQTAVPDNVRLAAQELEQLLGQAGYSPTDMSDAEIRAALDRMQAESMGGGYEQLPDTIKIDGVERPTRNSAGQPIAGTDEGVRAFYAWFGDSKVVDAEGRPLVVYHGTGSEFEAFEASGGLGKTFGTGAFFTANAATASSYAVGQSASVMPVYLALQNPAVFNARGTNWNAIGKNTKADLPSLVVPDNDEALLAELEGRQPSANATKKLKAKSTTLSRLWPGEFGYGDETASTDDLARWARGQGYEGVIVENVKDRGPSGAHATEAALTPSSIFVAFDPTQIKSVNNRGTFDPADARILYQEARARVIFDQGRTVVEMFQNRNLSSFFHEFGHMALENIRTDASLPDASDQVKQDWQTISDWFTANGHDLTDGIPTEAHELWARGVERYMMEGKAPSPGLKRVFETVARWMKAIYKHLDALRSPITPEIRDVMDRLFATDEEINAARENQALDAAFKDAASAGMSDAEFAAYRELTQDARADAHGALIEKVMRSVRARETAKYRAARETVKADVTESVDAMPLMRALKALKEVPLSREWIVDNMGQDALTLLPKRVPPLYRDNGSHPDGVAELSGYATGREMVEALIGAELTHRQAKEGGDQRSLRERMIETRTDAIMNERYGDPLNDGSIEREAMTLVHNEKQGEVIAAELRVLARQTNRRPTPYAMARDWARQKIRSGKVVDGASPSAIQRYLRSAAKAGKAAEAAMLKQDADEAFRQKQFQMLNNALVAEAKAAQDEVDSAVARMKKVADARTLKSVDQDYLEQAQALLEQVDLRKRSQVSLNRKESWASWAQARSAEGYDVVVPDSFAETLGQTNYTRLPVDTLLSLDDAVRQVMHLGRLKQTLIDNKEARDFAEVVDEAVSGAGNINGTPPKGLEDPDWKDALRGKALGIDAALLKMETVFDWLDGGNPNGVFNRIAFRPVAEAQARESAMLKDHMGRIKALFEAVPPGIAKRWHDKVALPFTDPFTGRPATMTRQRVVAMALNTGNEGNLQRLADGYGWNAGAIEAFLNGELTAEEWQFVQGVWDAIETLWPEIEALEKRVNGVAPDKVEPKPIVTPHGTLRGGYYPAIYDSTLDLTGEEQRGRDADLFAGAYTRANTRASATKARSEKVARPLLLDLGVINRHLGEVIHDLTHREAVMQAWKFLGDRRVASAVDAALGPEIRKQFRPWVKFVANSWALERSGNEGFGKWIGKLRANATAVGLGLRATTMVTQIAGYSNSIEVVGETAMAKALAQFSAHPVDTTNFVLERSDEVRHRMDTLDRDLRTEIARIATDNPASKAWARANEAKVFMFHGIGMMDRVVSVPTWLAAYNTSLMSGADEADAAYAGDKAVRVSQGAGAPKDLAAISRGTGKYGEALKLFTMFYSYFSAQYQRQRTLARDVSGADVRRPRSMPRLAARAFWLLVVPPLLVELLKAPLGAGGPDDEEAWAQWVMRKLLANSLGAIPLARDVFEPAWQAAIGGKFYNPSVTPLQRAYDSLVNTAKDAGKVARGEETKRATRDVLETVGYATGLVPGQVASATQFLVDVGNGDADPQDFGDWIEGLSTGKIKAD